MACSCAWPASTFPAERVEQRLDELLEGEAEIVDSLPLRPAVH